MSSKRVDKAQKAEEYAKNVQQKWNEPDIQPGLDCERLKSQNNISTELEADWQSWWSCKQLPLHINSCYEAARWVCCILSSEVLELLCIGF